jgi:hypothetical protein
MSTPTPTFPHRKGEGDEIRTCLHHEQSHDQIDLFQEKETKFSFNWDIKLHFNFLERERGIKILTVGPWYTDKVDRKEEDVKITG